MNQSFANETQIDKFRLIVNNLIVRNRSVIKRPTDSTTSTMNGQTSTTSEQTSTTSG